jgi:hypothetical protein
MPDKFDNDLSAWMRSKEFLEARAMVENFPL